MKLFGLTGGVGMGKSTSARILRERGIDVADTDDIAHDLVEPGRPALAEIQNAFGENIVDADARLRRDELARRVFSDVEARKRLEAILHPRISEVWHKQADAWRAAGKPCGVVVIPLLYETAAEKDFDSVICVACSAASQSERLRLRGWDPAQIAQRISAQWPVERKMDLANFVVWTEDGLDAHAQQLKRIIA